MTLNEQDLYEFGAYEIPNFQDNNAIRTNLLKLLSTTKARNNLKQALDRKRRMLNTYEDLKEFALHLLI